VKVGGRRPHYLVYSSLWTTRGSGATTTLIVELLVSFGGLPCL